jgi:hypothetical protein
VHEPLSFTALVVKFTARLRVAQTFRCPRLLSSSVYLEFAALRNP